MYAGDIIKIVLAGLLGITAGIVIVGIIVILYKKIVAPDTSLFSRILLTIVLMSIIASLIVANNYISDLKI